MRLLTMKIEKPFKLTEISDLKETQKLCVFNSLRLEPKLQRFYLIWKDFQIYFNFCQIMQRFRV